MRRGDLETKLAILHAISPMPLKLTHIMYKTELNCVSLKSQLNDLVNKGIVEKTATSINTRSLQLGRVYYKLTAKGIEILKVSKQLFNLLKEP